MSLNEILLFILFIIIIIFIGVYDFRYTEESIENFFSTTNLINGTSTSTSNSTGSSNVKSNDAKVNSKYVHDERNEVRQVTFNVDVPLNRYIIVSTPTPSADTSQNLDTSQNVDTSSQDQNITE